MIYLDPEEEILDVDGEAYLLWLAGEGPDPCPPDLSIARHMKAI
jgi:hypothetical protein